MEKEENKCYREVKKEQEARDTTTAEKERRTKEKKAFVKKFLPDVNNSPG